MERGTASSILLLEDEGHANEDRSTRRCSGGECGRQNARLAERPRHLAEEVNRKSRKRADEHHLRHSPAPANAQRKARRHEHHSRKQNRKGKERIEIKLVTERGKARILRRGDEAG